MTRRRRDAVGQVQPRTDLKEVAILLGRAYLRGLTEKRRNSAVFQAGEPQVSLDVPRAESPHVVDGTGNWRPPWKRPCSARSSASG